MRWGEEARKVLRAENGMQRERIDYDRDFVHTQLLDVAKTITIHLWRPQQDVSS
jgi:hypothetical protein